MIRQVMVSFDMSDEVFDEVFELTSIPIMDLREGGWALALWKSDELLVVDKDGCTICYLRTEN
ncbi:unnamed protein product [Prunus armeniaca]